MFLCKLPYKNEINTYEFNESDALFLITIIKNAQSRIFGSQGCLKTAQNKELHKKSKEKQHIFVTVLNVNLKTESHLTGLFCNGECS